MVNLLRGLVILSVSALLLIMGCSSGGSTPNTTQTQAAATVPVTAMAGGQTGPQIVQLGQLEPLGLNGIPPLNGNPENEIYQGVSSWAAPDGTEYALVASSRGLVIIDVTVPANAQMIQLVPLDGGSIHRDVEVYDHYAYVGGQQGAVTQIVDLSPLPNETPLIHTITPSIDYSHTLNVANGLLFLNSARNACRIYSLDNPEIPGLINTFTGDDCHDSFVRGDLMVSAGGGDGIYTLIDISDPINPVILGVTERILGIYAHSSWTNEDNTVLYAFEEAGARDILIFDIADKANPVLLSEFSMPEDTLMHNGAARGDYLFLAYYESGFVVLDVSDPTTPTLVGQAKTWPGDPTGFYNGAWNVNMSLPSGNILVSDMAGGVFIFDFEE